MFFTDKNLIFVVESPLGTVDKVIQKKIELVKLMFIKKFEKQLAHFDGDVSQFAMFEKDLDQVFKKMSLAEEWGNQLSGLKL